MKFLAVRQRRCYRGSRRKIIVRKRALFKPIRKDLTNVWLGDVVAHAEECGRGLVVPARSECLRLPACSVVYVRPMNEGFKV